VDVPSHLDDGRGGPKAQRLAVESRPKRFARVDPDAVPAGSEPEPSLELLPRRQLDHERPALMWAEEGRALRNLGIVEQQVGEIDPAAGARAERKERQRRDHERRDRRYETPAA
jgi:hypothetical protein